MPRPENLSVSISRMLVNEDQAHSRVVSTLNVVAAHRLSFAADRKDRGSRFGGDWRAVVKVAIGSGCTASFNLGQTAARHVVGKLGIGIDGIVVGLDAVGVVDSKFVVVFGYPGQYFDRE